MSSPLFAVTVKGRLVTTGSFSDCNQIAKEVTKDGKMPVVSRATGIVENRAQASATRARALIVQGCGDPAERKKVSQAIKTLNASGGYKWSHILQEANAGCGLTTEQAAWIVGEAARIKAARRVQRSLQSA